jgi:hypothetical protein
MTTEQRDPIIEKSMEARQAESRSSVLLLLTISIGLTTLIVGVVWLVFFHQ